MEKVTCQCPEKSQPVGLSRSCQAFITQLSLLKGETARSDDVPSGIAGS